MAWYPLYRVPEAPLTARFLTFHTLASLWEAASEAAAQHARQLDEAAQAAAAAGADAAELAADGAAAATTSATDAANEVAPAAPEEGSCEDSEGSEGEEGVSPRRAAPAPGASRGGLPLRPSYKSMLEAGLPPAAAEAPAGEPQVQTATPTAVCSFPGSPTCSDAGTRTTLGGSRPQSLDGASQGRSRLVAGSCAGSLAPPSSSGAGSERCACSCSEGSASAAPSATPTASEAGDCGEALPVPVAGLAWYATGRDENWTETLVAYQLPAGALPGAGEMGDGCCARVGSCSGAAGSAALALCRACRPLPAAAHCACIAPSSHNALWTPTLSTRAGLCPAPGTLVAGGARVVGCWRGVAVLARPHPVSKGGPLGWEIQQEEMAACAERLATGGGLLALRPRAGAPRGAWHRLAGLSAAQLGVACPDYEFFASRMQRYFGY